MQASEACVSGRHRKCPECGAALCYDAGTGESICSECGLVVEVEAFEEPPQPKNRKALVALPATSKPLYSDLEELDFERRRVYSKIGRYGGKGDEKKHESLVEQYADKISAPEKVRILALLLAKKIAKGLRKAGKKLKKEDIARVALWEACKICGFWVTLQEFEGACGLKSEKRGIYALLSKVSDAVEMDVVVPKPSYYIPRLAARLIPFVRDVQYISALEEYAAKICAEAERRKLTNGKDPVCVAGTALHIVDERLGGRIGRARMAAAGIKYSQEVAKTLTALKVPIPESALKFLWYLLIEVKKSELENSDRQD